MHDTLVLPQLDVDAFLGLWLRDCTFGREGRIVGVTLASSTTLDGGGLVAKPR